MKLNRDKITSIGVPNKYNKIGLKKDNSDTITHLDVMDVDIKGSRAKVYFNDRYISTITFTFKNKKYVKKFMKKLVIC